MNVRIKEDSWLAWIAARKLKSKSVAIVFGKTIHLWNVRREVFLKSPVWVLHELEHVRQFQQHGRLFFTLLYLWESVRSGYHNNRFEVEARKAEQNEIKLQDIRFS